MPRIETTKEQLRTQIRSASAEHFSTEQIEERIAASLLTHGRFEDRINADELAVILRNVVYTVFADQSFAGHDVGLVHNISTMKININESEAEVCFIVHIHQPILAFLSFQYVLVNDSFSDEQRLRVKIGSLKINQHTRRFDIKAKAALAAINVERIACQQLADPTAIIIHTLSPRIKQYGVRGEIHSLTLLLQDHGLRVCVEGEFYSPEDESSEEPNLADTA